MKNHSDAVNAVLLEVSRLGGLPLKYTSGMFKQMDGDRPVRIGKPGASDVIACIGGVFFGIEVKFSDNDKLGKEQESFRDAVQDVGGIWILADFRRGRDGCEVVRHAFNQLTNKTSAKIRAARHTRAQCHASTVSRPSVVRQAWGDGQGPCQCCWVHWYGCP
jgi:hypothetical protein